MKNENELPPAEPKRNYAPIILLCFIFLVIGVSLSFLKELFVKYNNDSVTVIESPVIYIPEIANPDVDSIINTVFWAKMYRIDEKTKKVYFVVDRQKGLVKEMVGADSETFEPLTGGDGAKFSYGKDKNGIYCNEVLRPDISTKTFKFNKWTALYAYDKKHVYVNCEILEGADLETFVQLGEQSYESHFAKDKNRVYFEGKILKKADPATFSIIYPNIDSYSRDQNNLYLNEKLVGSTQYKFEPNSSGEILLVGYNSPSIIFSQGQKADVVDKIFLSDAERSNGLLVYKENFYYFDPGGYLNMFNLLTNTSSKVLFPKLALLDAEGKPMINSIFFEDNNIYLLYGENCNQYLKRCDLDLLRFDRISNQIDKIAEHIGSREIIGLDEDTNNLYLRYADGDGGCGWSSYLVYNLNTKAKTLEKGVSLCDGDKEYDKILSSEEDFIQKIKGDIIHSDRMYIQNGKIVLPPDSSANVYGDIIYFVN